MDGPVNGTAFDGAVIPLDVQVGVDQGRVRIDFTKPIAWLAMPPTEAMTLAQQILAHSCALTGLSLTLVVGEPQGVEQHPPVRPS